MLKFIYIVYVIFMYITWGGSHEGAGDAEIIVKDLAYHYRKNLSGKTGSDEADIEPAA
jgi:hypothetical protein